MEWPRTKKSLLKKMRLKWAAKDSCFDKIKILIIMTSLQNIVISGAQGLMMLMGSKFLIMKTKPQNIQNNVLLPGHLHQKF